MNKIPVPPLLTGKSRLILVPLALLALLAKSLDGKVYENLLLGFAAGTLTSLAFW